MQICPQSVQNFWRPTRYPSLLVFPTRLFNQFDKLCKISFQSDFQSCLLEKRNTIPVLNKFFALTSGALYVNILISATETLLQPAQRQSVTKKWEAQHSIIAMQLTQPKHNYCILCKTTHTFEATFATHESHLEATHVPWVLVFKTSCNRNICREFDSFCRLWCCIVPIMMLYCADYDEFYWEFDCLCRLWCCIVPIMLRQYYKSLSSPSVHLSIIRLTFYNAPRRHQKKN